MEIKIGIPCFDLKNQRNFEVAASYVKLTDERFLFVVDVIRDAKDSDSSEYDPFVRGRECFMESRIKRNYCGWSISFSEDDEYSSWVVYIMFNGAQDIKILFSTKTEAREFVKKVELWSE